MISQAVATCAVAVHKVIKMAKKTAFIGREVMHWRFGTGTIVDISPDVVLIEFGGQRVKEFPLFEFVDDVKLNNSPVIIDAIRLNRGTKEHVYLRACLDPETRARDEERERAAREEVERKQRVLDSRFKMKAPYSSRCWLCGVPVNYESEDACGECGWLICQNCKSCKKGGCKTGVERKRILGQ